MFWWYLGYTIVDSHHSGNIRSVAKRHHFSHPRRSPGEDKDQRATTRLPKKEERVRRNDTEAVGLGERSTHELETVVNTSRRIRSPATRNNTSTQMEASVVTPESNIRSNKMWLQMSQFIPGELERATKFIGNKSCTLDDIVNTSQDVRKRKNIGTNSLYRGNSYKENQPYRFHNKDKPKEKREDVTNKKKACHNCGSTGHYAKKSQKEKKDIYAIEKVPDEETQEEDSASQLMGYSIGEISDYDKDPIEEFLV
ncbi:hypothetical protein O181_065822 [Austropuccinia psidii MF-1]|uniref:CCHC-type domain-containing protein n=1 Tax=Austropuccinia psidii MF-1 TaxID=1389203 RepID=A0A9Q3I3N4_9BASI|nr:hypothetical protein [Austropuccinia psidii MF-1]